jgi:hypothetical protein
MGQNSGVPGFGGLSAFVQPSLTRYWGVYEGSPPEISSAISQLVDVQRTVVAAGVIAAAALLWRRRITALHAASYLFLVTFVVNPNFAYQYLIWGLPFFVAAGYLKQTALLQAAILPATLWLYWRPGLAAEGWAYLVAIQVVWIGLVVVLVMETWKLLRAPQIERRAPAPRRAVSAT